MTSLSVTFGLALTSLVFTFILAFAVQKLQDDVKKLKKATE